MDDNDNSTDGYGGSCDGGYGDSDTDSSYGGGYGDVDDDCDDTGSYGDDSNSYSDYGGYDDDGSNDNSSYSKADDGITDDDMAMSAYSSCEDTMDAFDADLDQTFSAPAYGDTDGWYGSITEECEQAYDTVVDALESFVDTFSGKNNDTDTMPSELDTTDLLADRGYQPEDGIQDTDAIQSEMTLELDTTDLPNNERNMDFSVADSFSDFKTRVAVDYEANIDNNVRHAQETAALGAMPFSIVAGELVGGQFHMGKEGMAVGVAAGVAAATGYGYITGKIGGTITTAFEAVEDVITGHDVDEKDDE